MKIIKNNKTKFHRKYLKMPWKVQKKQPRNILMTSKILTFCVSKSCNQTFYLTWINAIIKFINLEFKSREFYRIYRFYTISLQD